MITDHTELRIYRNAFELAVRVHEVSRRFPSHEDKRLTDQIMRSSRSPCATIAEAWRKRRYPLVFVNKLSDAEAEVAETRVWLEFAQRLRYLPETAFRALDSDYCQLLSQIVNTRTTKHRWSNFQQRKRES